MVPLTMHPPTPNPPPDGCGLVIGKRCLGRISVFGNALEIAAFLETAAGRARRSARAANVARHPLDISGARGATRPTSPSIVLDRSESEMRPFRRRPQLIDSVSIPRPV